MRWFEIVQNSIELLQTTSNYLKPPQTFSIIKQENSHITFPLDSFLQRLELADYYISPADRIRVLKVLEAFGKDHLQSPEALKYHLAPILVQSAEEQEHLYELFDQFLKDIKGQAIKSPPRKLHWLETTPLWVWWLMGATLLLLAAIPTIIKLLNSFMGQIYSASFLNFTAMRTRLFIYLLSFMLFFSFEAIGQKGKKKYKAPKDPVKTAQKKEVMEERELGREMKKVKKAHLKLQGKKTAKRMKNNRKRSTRHSQHKKDPFLQRLFSGKKKKVKTENYP